MKPKHYDCTPSISATTPNVTTDNTDKKDKTVQSKPVTVIGWMLPDEFHIKIKFRKTKTHSIQVFKGFTPYHDKRKNDETANIINIKVFSSPNLW